MTQEEQETEAFIRLRAINAVTWQKAAQAGLEMKTWVESGQYDFIQTRILAPLEIECFKKIKSVRLGGSAIANVAKVQGTLEVFDKIKARIENLIQNGQDALDHLKDLQDSTQPKEGE